MVIWERSLRCLLTYASKGVMRTFGYEMSICSFVGDIYQVKMFFICFSEIGRFKKTNKQTHNLISAVNGMAGVISAADIIVLSQLLPYWKWEEW